MRGRSDLRACSARPRGSEQDGTSAEANGRDGGQTRKGSIAQCDAELNSFFFLFCTYLWLIVLCTINNEVNTRSVRRSVHRLESGERAEGRAVKERWAATTTRSGSISGFLSLSLSRCVAGGNTRARDGRTRERGLYANEN